MAEIFRSNKLSINQNVYFSSPEMTPQNLIIRARNYNITTVPLDIVSLCETLGINIQYEQMKNDISGILQNRENGWTIIVNVWQHENRQRFTIAHELGHYFLHRNKNSEFITKSYHTRMEQNNNRFEREADRFAAELLMPRDKFIEQINSGNNKISSLSEYFKTSMLAVKIRARELGY